MEKFLHFSKEDVANAQQFPCMDIEGIRNKLYNDFYEELEVTVCSIMAAGVPLSDICITSPKMLIVDNVISLQGHISFYP